MLGAQCYDKICSTEKFANFNTTGMKFDVEKYARLARVKLTSKESKKISEDLESILDHFKELQELDTKDVLPMTGGTSFKNVFRDDESESEDYRVSSGVEEFPEVSDGYLKVPKIFE